MIRNNLFQTIKNKKGLIGIKYADTDGVLAIIAHSPYASERSKLFLEMEILRAYNRYYKLVYHESMGGFFQKETNLIKIETEDFKWLDYAAGQKETS